MKKILIVDDDKMTRMLIRIYLENDKDFIFIYDAENGCAALEILKCDPSIAVVILDLNMPECDGYDFLIEISKYAIFDQVKVYISSASSRSEFDRNIKIKGIDINCVCGYLQKPIFMEDLLNAIFIN